MRSHCAWHNFISWGYLGTILCCSGIVLSILALYSFAAQKRHINQASTLVLQSLAWVDILLLVSVMITDCIPYICEYTDTCRSPWVTWPYVRYLWLATPLSHLASVWLITLIAANRYYAVCRPYRVDIVWSLARTRIAVALVLGAAFLYNVPRLLEYKMDMTFDPCTNTTYLMEQATEFSRRKTYRIGYKAILTSMVLIALPLLIQTTLTMAIIKFLTKRPKTTASKSSDRRTSEVTVMLIVVIITAIVCQLPLGVYHIVRSVIEENDRSCANALYWLNTVSKLAVNANPTLNFFVYLTLSRPFRDSLPCTSFLTSKYSTNCAIKYQVDETRNVKLREEEEHGVNRSVEAIGAQGFNEIYID